jgi:hypothetical protein
MRQVSTVDNPGLSFGGKGLVVGGKVWERMIFGGCRVGFYPTTTSGNLVGWNPTLRCDAGMQS